MASVWAKDGKTMVFSFLHFADGQRGGPGTADQPVPEEADCAGDGQRGEPTIGRTGGAISLKMLFIFVLQEGIPCWSLYSEADLVKFRSALDILVGDLLPPPAPIAQQEQQQQQQVNFLTVRG